MENFQVLVQQGRSKSEVRAERGEMRGKARVATPVIEFYGPCWPPLLVTVKKSPLKSQGFRAPPAQLVCVCVCVYVCGRVLRIVTHAFGTAKLLDLTPQSRTPECV